VTDRERLMYRVMGKIYESDAPIVFKGAMVVRKILQDGGIASIDRPTKDIDSHWIGSPPSMGVLVLSFPNFHQVVGKRESCIERGDRRKKEEIPA
jgi:hypothetical protein